MLVFVTLDFALFKSQVHNCFLDNDPLIGFHFLPFWSAILSRKIFPSWLWWKEPPGQHVQWDFVESTVQHTTSEMRHRKFMGYYRMSFETFKNLIKELTPFLQSQCVNLVRPQVKKVKIVTIVIYRLAHGTSATHKADQFNVGASTIRKYVDIVCDTLCDKNKLFSKYINIPSSDHL